MTKNFPLFVLVSGIAILILIVTLLQPGVQTELVNLLGLDPEFNSTSSTAKKSGTERVLIKSVVDGDTVKLQDGRTVRYLNIDTPETKKPNSPKQCFGPESSEANKKLVDQKHVWIMPDKQDKDRYDRLLRFVFLQKASPTNVDQSVNAFLVKEGFARTLIIKPNDTYAKDFLKLERKAVDQKSGVWGRCPKPFEK